MKSNKTSKAFTLIELLVVISIIAILMAVLMPALSRAREQARRTLCSSNQRGINLALAVYAESYNTFPVPADDIDGDGNMWEAGDMWVYTLAAGNYLGKEIGNLRFDKGIWSCPSGERAYIDSDTIDPGHGITIGMNDGTTNIDEPDMPMVVWPSADYYSKPIRVASIANPANTVLTADVQNTWSVYTWRWANNMPVPNDRNSYAIRHYDGCNFSFVDGHTEFESAEPEQIKYGICRPARFKYHFDNYNFK